MTQPAHKASHSLVARAGEGFEFSSAHGPRRPGFSGATPCSEPVFPASPSLPPVSPRLYRQKEVEGEGEGEGGDTLDHIKLVPLNRRHPESETEVHLPCGYFQVNFSPAVTAEPPPPLSLKLSTSWAMILLLPAACDLAIADFQGVSQDLRKCHRSCSSPGLFLRLTWKSSRS